MRLVHRFAAVATALVVVLAIGIADVHAQIFTSLEGPPTRADIDTAIAAGIKMFDFDLDKDGAADAVKVIKAKGGKVTAYHVGGGGGRAWGSLKTGEFVRRYDEPKDFLALTGDVKRLVAKGADYVHFDNTHRFSGKRLESIADAIVAGGAGFIAKNNAGKWNLVMKRRPDLRPAYAVVEDAMFSAEETQAAANLHARGVPIYVVGFRKPITPDAYPVTDDYARQYAANNPWARILVIDDERAYDSRTGTWVTASGN
jgi:hypothetical protein